MARKLKHKKLRNTGLIYELLIRQLTSDVLNNKTPKSMSIINKYFGKNSPLTEELHLYETALSQKVKDSTFALKTVEAIIESKEYLDKKELSRLKYNLIKEISDNFNQDAFFKSKVDNYPVYASLCTLLEYEEKENPAEYNVHKISVAEHILSPTKESDTIKERLSEVDPELRLITFKLLIEKFNSKWSNFNKTQREILRQFVFNSTNTPESRAFINETIDTIDTQIKKVLKNPPTEVIKVKLAEVSKLLPKIKNAPKLNESHYMSLIRYHELLKELKCPID